MADKPVAEVVDVDAVIDALSPSPSSSDVYEATLPFNPHAVAASAVRRAGEGGGGAAPGSASVIGPFEVDYNTSGITTTGVILHTFTTDTLVIAGALFASTPWAGANPIYFQVTAGPNVANPGNNYPLWTNSDLSDGTVQADYTRWPLGAVTSQMVIVAAGGVLSADAYGIAGMTAGVGQIYALVAEVTP